MEEYGVPPAYHDHTVRRNAIHQEIACLKSCFNDGITQLDCEVPWRTAIVTTLHTLGRYMTTEQPLGVGVGVNVAVAVAVAVAVGV